MILRYGFVFIGVCLILEGPDFYLLGQNIWSGHTRYFGSGKFPTPHIFIIYPDLKSDQEI
jgi:hypothetical protein